MNSLVYSICITCTHYSCNRVTHFSYVSFMFNVQNVKAYLRRGTARELLLSYKEATQGKKKKKKKSGSAADSLETLLQCI